jgi:2-oxoglutarate/2-oxoacid ferredoxin oxidoreductase subunit alpha
MATALKDVEQPRPGLETVDSIVIRFAGDSGDGMQLTGGQFTLSTALTGNDLATFPDFPAEIRAPQGTTFGVSSFQINLGAVDIETAGDAIDVLVAMNPAALKTNLNGVRKGGLLLCDTGEFTTRNLQKAGYTASPLEDGSLGDYQVLAFNVTQLTIDAVKPFGLGNKDAIRCKNMWTLGLALWMFDRDREPLVQWLKDKFAKKPELAEANIAALNAGHAFGETAELGDLGLKGLHRFHVNPVKSDPGLYRTVTGGDALSLGLVAGAQLANLPLFFGSYPITPASSLLHALSKMKEFGVTTFQAEDEIAAIAAAIGASFGGQLGVTSSSGPGIALKGEAMGLAISTELPLVIVNSQRGGPSTGLPTKTEQSDLYQAVYGRNGDAPLAVIASRSAADCFEVAIEACRLATQFMTPVMLLTDGYIANAAEPWRVPSMGDYQPFPVHFHDQPLAEGEKLNPFARDPDTLKRIWIKPGTPGLMHRIGGIEKGFDSGNIDYSPANHQKMTDTRMGKIAGIANHIPLQAIEQGSAEDTLVVVGWGSTYGPISQAVRRQRAAGKSVAHIHVRYMWPLPKNLGTLLKGFKKIIVPEMNTGQLKTVLRDQYLVDAQPLNKVDGQPFKIAQIEAAIEKALGRG